MRPPRRLNNSLQLSLFLRHFCARGGDLQGLRSRFALPADAVDQPKITMELGELRALTEAVAEAANDRASALLAREKAAFWWRQLDFRMVRGMRICVLVTGLVGVMTSACGGTAATGRVEIQRAALTSATSSAVFSVDVANGTDAPIFIYDSVRSVVRDDSQGQTGLRYRDVPWKPTASSADCHLGLPTYRKVEALSVLHMNLTVPAAYIELSFPSSVSSSAPPTSPSEIPVAHAREVLLEFAWSDAPFTPARSGALCSAELADALIALQRGVATALVQP